jgi:hypothetical protein
MAADIAIELPIRRGSVVLKVLGYLREQNPRIVAVASKEKVTGLGE